MDEGKVEKTGRITFYIKPQKLGGGRGPSDVKSKENRKTHEKVHKKRPPPQPMTYPEK